MKNKYHHSSTSAATYIFVPLTVGLALVLFVLLFATLFGGGFKATYSAFTDGSFSINSQKKSKAHELYSGEFDNQPDVFDNADVDIPNFGDKYARLASPALEIDVPVYYGDDAIQLANGAAQSPYSLLPGYGKPVLIGAHNSTYFANLERVELGDEFIVTTSYGSFKYQVSSIVVADFDDKTVFDLNDDVERLILYTCHPFTFFSLNGNERLFVLADKVGGPQVGGLN